MPRRREACETQKAEKNPTDAEAISLNIMKKNPSGRSGNTKRADGGHFGFKDGPTKVSRQTRPVLQRPYFTVGVPLARSLKKEGFKLGRRGEKKCTCLLKGKKKARPLPRKARGSEWGTS